MVLNKEDDDDDDDEAQFVVELTIAFRLGFGHHLQYRLELLTHQD